MHTNFVGTLAVTQAMLPLLRNSSAARLIGYNASKRAVNMLTVQLAEELRDTTIVVNSVSPGYVKTDLMSHNRYMLPEEGAQLPVEYALLAEDAVSGRFIEPSAETHW